MQLRFSIDGEMQLSRNLEAISVNISDWTPAFEQTGDYLMGVFQDDVFETEGQAIEETWDALTAAYAARKEKQYGDQGILQATGTMRNSFWKQIDTTSLIIGNDTPYFKFHQSNEPRTKLPRRAMLKLTNDMKQQIVSLFQQQILATLQT